MLTRNPPVLEEASYCELPAFVFTCTAAVPAIVPSAAADILDGLTSSTGDGAGVGVGVGVGVGAGVDDGSL